MSKEVENMPQQVNESNEEFHNLSDAENAELLQLLEQSGDWNWEEYKSRMGELSAYWGRLLIGLLKTSRWYKEELDIKDRTERYIHKKWVLKDLSRRTVREDDVKLAWFSWTLLELRWWDKKKFESFEPSYYYIWGMPITMRKYKHYLEDNTLPKKVEKYVVTEKEICDWLGAINEQMKVRWVDNDGDIDYKTQLEWWEHKVLAWEYLKEIAPELCLRTVTREGLCRENNWKWCRFGPDDGKSYHLFLKLPKELVESHLFRVSCTEGWNIL